MWQALYDELKDRNFTIIAVAMDSRDGDPAPWIEKANPEYVTLIDKEHRLADLYNMVNVPQAVWIDEDGTIVRPTENAGAYEAFRSLDFKTMTIPDDELGKAKQTKTSYYDALRDWVAKGADSEFAFDRAAARDHAPVMTADMALAHTKFRLGQYLQQLGQSEEADALLRQAAELHPDSWNMWRQHADPLENGLAAGPDFWQRVSALGKNGYYPLPDMKGMPD